MPSSEILRSKETPDDPDLLQQHQIAELVILLEFE
jgi:hypothetical protein